MPEHGHQVSDLIRPDLADRLWQLRAELLTADPADMAASAGQQLAEPGPPPAPAARREPRRFEYPVTGPPPPAAARPHPAPPRIPRPSLPVGAEPAQRRGMPAARRRERRMRAIRNREGRTGTGTDLTVQDGSQDRSQDAK